MNQPPLRRLNEGWIVVRHLTRVSVQSTILLLAAMSTFCAASEEVQFDRHIRPILAKNCFHCHGPDEEDRQADLRLDREDGLYADLGGYRAVVPHSPAESELYLRVTSDIADQQMPPPDSGYQLSDQEVTIIRRWIEQGAVWKQHWSFVSPKRPTLPRVSKRDWCRNPVDQFVLAKLEAVGLEPSPRADLRTLIRRVTFDLTGLPPTVDEVHEFLADTSPESYERLVDRLLDSPHYGEHEARYWLDVARYGDTHGLHVDNYREMWPYRDWVVRAFNSNLPYDEFLVEQLAGDLLQEPTLDQQIASGFNRCHVTTNEGGSIAEEVYVRNVVDRVSTMGTAMMGLTLGCAVCHDHKFDPVTQRDFYQLFAFFNNLDGPEMDGNTKHPAPVVRVPTPEQSRCLSDLKQQIERLQWLSVQHRAANIVSTKAWVSQKQQQQTNSGGVTAPNVVNEGLVAYCKFDEDSGTEVRSSCSDDEMGSLEGNVNRVGGVTGAAVQLFGDGYVELGDIGRFEIDNPFSFGAWVKVQDSLTGAVVARMDIKDLEKGYLLSVDDGYLVTQLNGRWPGYSIKVTTKEPVIHPGCWQHIFVTYDGKKLAPGLVVYVDGLRQVVDINCDSIHSEGSISTDNPLQIGRRDEDPPFEGLAVDDFRIYDRSLPDDQVRTLYLLPQVGHLLATSPDTWTDDQWPLVQEYVAIITDPVFQDLSRQHHALQQTYKELLLEVATSPVFRERRNPRSAFLLVRGEYDQRGEKVKRQTPAMLPPMRSNLPHTRLGLAKWLVDNDHPLTSRVAVNRFWQQLFGTGLVETSEDFGIQGKPPSHPALLDWLACEFRETDWDVKALLKTLVMSATYQQSSLLTPELIERDPLNRLFARGPRYRLDAEMLRDQALTLSGLLVRQMGGPSVKPPQPNGLWRAVGLSSSDTVEFQQDHGDDKVHRRSIYTFWKRTSPPPQMATFDAPSREACVMRRERTNTPLQALLLMNDPQYMEAARHIAERILQLDTDSSKKRMMWAFEQVTFRLPSEEELKELMAAHDHFREEFDSDRDSAMSVIKVGEIPPVGQLSPSELASWTMVANLLLNLDEVITKE